MSETKRYKCPIVGCSRNTGTIDQVLFHLKYGHGLSEDALVKLEIKEYVETPKE